MFPVIYLVLGSIVLILLAARMSGRVFLAILLPTSPLLLAILGTLLVDTFGLSVPGALFLAVLILALTGGIIYQANRRARLARRSGARQGDWDHRG